MTTIAIIKKCIDILFPKLMHKLTAFQDKDYKHTPVGNISLHQQILIQSLKPTYY